MNENNTYSPFDDEDEEETPEEREWIDNIVEEARLAYERQKARQAGGTPSPHESDGDAEETDSP